MCKLIVGEYPARERTNKNGERLIEICRAHNLILKSTAFKRLPRKQKLWVSPNPNLGEFQIDHVAVTKLFHKEIQNVRVLKGANLDSDHFLSKIKINIILKRKRKANNLPLKGFDTEKIQKSDDFSKMTADLKDRDWEEIRAEFVSRAKNIVAQEKQKTRLVE